MNRNDIIKAARENVKRTSWLQHNYQDRAATQHESISNSYSVGVLIAQTISDWENGGIHKDFWDGFADALKVEHRYLQNSIILDALHALHSLKEEDYDARNEFAIECCELLDHVLSYESHKQLREKKACTPSDATT